MRRGTVEQGVGPGVERSVATRRSWWAPVVFARYLCTLAAGLVGYSVVSRRTSLLVAVVVGIVVMAVALAGQAAAPFVVYPFV